MYIAIAGNIGSGKTTLTNMLAKHYGWKKFLEPVDDNPYIDDYYKDISRWALNLEVYFLKQRFKNLLEIEKSKETIIQDRTIFEGVYVFATNNKNMGNMDERGQDRSPLYPDLRKRAVSLSSELQKPSPSLNGLRRPGWGICVLYNRDPLKKHRRLIVSGAFRQNIPFSNLFRIPEGTSCTGTSGRGPAP